MSLFIDPRTKKRKNPVVLISFLTAVLFLLIYGFFFTVLTDPLYRHVALGNPVLTTVVHGLLISLAGTAVCCLAFLLPDKRIAPLGFVALAVFLALSCVAAALLDADARSVMSFRVPTNDVSVVDLTARLKQSASYHDVCVAIENASQNSMKGIIAYTTDQVVSSDLTGNAHTCVFDETAGIMLDDNFVKLIAWYDNEWGYTSKILDLISHMYEVDHR